MLTRAGASNVFSKKIKIRINSLEQKKEPIKKLKLDFLNIIKFNKSSSLRAEQFISKIIYRKTKCRYLYVVRILNLALNEGNIKL